MTSAHGRTTQMLIITVIIIHTVDRPSAKILYWPTYLNDSIDTAGMSSVLCPDWRMTVRAVHCCRVDSIIVLVVELRGTVLQTPSHKPHHHKFHHLPANFAGEPRSASPCWALLFYLLRKKTSGKYWNSALKLLVGRQEGHLPVKN